MTDTHGGPKVADPRPGYVEVPSWVGASVATIFLGLSAYALKTSNDAYYTAISNSSDIKRIDTNQNLALRDLQELKAQVYQMTATVAGHEKFNQVTDERLQALRGDAQQLHDQIYRMLASSNMEVQRRPLFPGDSATGSGGQPPPTPRDGRSPSR